MTSTVSPSAAQIRAARSLLGWSQQDLAGKAGVAVSTITDFERGQRNPMPNNALAIRQALEHADIVFTESGVRRGLSLTFRTEETAGSLSMSFDANSVAAMTDLLSMFGSIEQGKATMSTVQCASPRLKTELSAFVEAYGTSNPQLRRLLKIISGLRDGEFFLLLPESPTSSRDQLDQEVLLRQLNHPEERSLAWEYQQMFGVLLEAYDMCSPRTDRRTEIGPARRRDRACRFCGGTVATGATFTMKAHAVSASIGNMHLKSNEECDECNGYFGDKIEPSLIELLNVQRVFLGIKSRGSFPTIKYTEGSIFHDGNRMVISAKNVSQDASGVLTAQLGSGRPIVPRHVYRTLCKFALSVIPADQLPALDKTVTWVRHGDPSDVPLPKIATTLVALPPDPSAQITLYIRKQDDLRTPHVVCEFRIGCFMYVYVLPFSTRDERSLIGFFEEKTFKDIFRHYSHVSSWTLQDHSADLASETLTNIRLEPRTT